MEHIIALDQGLSKYRPLKRIIAYDDFDKGLCGWMDLHPNHVGKDFNTLRYSHVDKTKWGPIMLSSASFRLAGTPCSMEGTYLMTLSTRTVARTYPDTPAPVSSSHGHQRTTPPYAEIRKDP